MSLLENLKKEIEAAGSDVTGLIINDQNDVKLRDSVLEKLNELVIKKQLDESKNPRKIENRDEILNGSVEATGDQEKLPLFNKKAVHDEFEGANERM